LAKKNNKEMVMKNTSEYITKLKNDLVNIMETKSRIIMGEF